MKTIALIMSILSVFSLLGCGDPKSAVIPLEAKVDAAYKKLPTGLATRYDRFKELLDQIEVDYTTAKGYLDSEYYGKALASFRETQESLESYEQLAGSFERVIGNKYQEFIDLKSSISDNQWRFALEELEALNNQHEEIHALIDREDVESAEPLIDDASERVETLAERTALAELYAKHFTQIYNSVYSYAPQDLEKYGGKEFQALHDALQPIEKIVLDGILDTSDYQPLRDLRFLSAVYELAPDRIDEIVESAASIAYFEAAVLDRKAEAKQAQIEEMKRLQTEMEFSASAESYGGPATQELLKHMSRAEAQPLSYEHKAASELLALSEIEMLAARIDEAAKGDFTEILSEPIEAAHSRLLGLLSHYKKDANPDRLTQGVLQNTKAILASAERAKRAGMEEREKQRKKLAEQQRAAAEKAAEDAAEKQREAELQASEFAALEKLDADMDASRKLKRVGVEPLREDMIHTDFEALCRKYPSRYSDTLMEILAAIDDAGNTLRMEDEVARAYFYFYWAVDYAANRIIMEELYITGGDPQGIDLDSLKKLDSILTHKNLYGLPVAVKSKHDVEMAVASRESQARPDWYQVWKSGGFKPIERTNLPPAVPSDIQHVESLRKKLLATGCEYAFYTANGSREKILTFGSLNQSVDSKDDWQTSDYVEIDGETYKLLGIDMLAFKVDVYWFEAVERIAQFETRCGTDAFEAAEREQWMNEIGGIIERIEEDLTEFKNHGHLKSKLSPWEVSMKEIFEAQAEAWDQLIEEMEVESKGLDDASE